MKTSLICLLLLAAVACAAPPAGEMAEEKREEMAEEKREDMAEEKREEMAEVAEAAGARLAESRQYGYGFCFGRCPSAYLSCWFPGLDTGCLYYEGYGSYCSCCRVTSIIDCFYPVV